MCNSRRLKSELGFRTSPITTLSPLCGVKNGGRCAHGIYPFTDANVEDFDPIFAELVRVSGDQSNILYQPDEYAKAFVPVGEKLVTMWSGISGTPNSVQVFSSPIV